MFPWMYRTILFPNANFVHTQPEKRQRECTHTASTEAGKTGCLPRNGYSRRNRDYNSALLNVAVKIWNQTLGGSTYRECYKARKLGFTGRIPMSWWGQNHGLFAYCQGVWWEGTVRSLSGMNVWSLMEWGSVWGSSRSNLGGVACLLNMDVAFKWMWDTVAFFSKHLETDEVLIEQNFGEDLSPAHP